MSETTDPTYAPIPIEEVDRRLQTIRRRLRHVYAVDPERSDPIWKAQLYTEVLIHRIADLASEALELHRNGSLVAAMTLARSVVESAAMLYWLLLKLRHHSDQRDDAALESTVITFLFGSRQYDSEYQMPNILTGLDQLDREFPGSRRMHEILSEFVHPNGGGVVMSYAELNADATIYTLGRRSNPPSEPMALESLAIALSVSAFLYDQIYSICKDV